MCNTNTQMIYFRRLIYERNSRNSYVLPKGWPSNVAAAFSLHCGSRNFH